MHFKQTKTPNYWLLLSDLCFKTSQRSLNICVLTSKAVRLRVYVKSGVFFFDFNWECQGTGDPGEVRSSRQKREQRWRNVPITVSDSKVEQWVTSFTVNYTQRNYEAVRAGFTENYLIYIFSWLLLPVNQKIGHEVKRK